MKILIATTFLFLFCTTVSGQKKLTLHFKDGSTETGYVTFEKKKILISEKRTTKARDKKEIDFRTVDSAVTYVKPIPGRKGRKPKVLHIFPSEKGNKYEALVAVKGGKVRLYKGGSALRGYGVMWMMNTGVNADGSMNSIPIFMPGGKSKPVPIYYVMRDGYPRPIQLGGETVWKNFRKDAEKVFGDCSELMEKIRRRKKGFTKKNLPNIVKYYNKNCG